MSQMPTPARADRDCETPEYFELRPVSEGAALALGGPRSGVRTADPRAGTPTNGRAARAGGSRTSGNPSRAGASRRLSAPRRASAVRGATPPDPAQRAGKAANAQAAGRSAQPERERGFGALPALSAGSAQAAQPRAARVRAETVTGRRRGSGATSSPTGRPRGFPARGSAVTCRAHRHKYPAVRWVPHATAKRHILAHGRAAPVVTGMCDGYVRQACVTQHPISSTAAKE